MIRLLISAEDLAWCWSLWTRAETMASLAFMAEHQLAIPAGVEYFPATHRLADQALYPTTGLIAAAMQSWRSEENWRKLWAFWRHHFRNPSLCGLATVSYIRVTERRASMKQLAALRAAYGPDLPITVYPHHANCIIGGQHWEEPGYPEFAGLARDGGIVLVQPEPGLIVADRWNTPSAYSFWTRARHYGFTGICLNLGYLYAAWPNDWRAAMDFLIPHTRLVRAKVAANYPLEDMLSYLRRWGYSGSLVVYGVRPGVLAKRGAFIEAANRALETVSKLLI